MLRLRIFTVALLFLASGSGRATAHARWFIVNEPIPEVPAFSFDIFHAAMFGVATFMIFAGLCLDRATDRNPRIALYLRDPVKTMDALDWRLLSVAFGSTLIFGSMSHFFVAPDMPLGRGSFDAVLAYLQIIIGAMFVLQSRILLASVATIVVLPLSCIIQHSLASAIDYSLELIGIGVAMMLVAPLISKVDEHTLRQFLRRFSSRRTVSLNTAEGPFHLHWRASLNQACPPQTEEWRLERFQLGARILRIALGLQLVILALHDKLWFPGASLAFVEKNAFVNVPALLGIDAFTNLHFVLGAGMVEVALGIMLVSGIAPRISSCFLLCIFSLTGLIFGIHELIGHLPIMAAFLVVALAGESVRPSFNAGGLAEWVMSVRGLALASCPLLVVTGFVLNSPKLMSASSTVHSASVPQALYRKFAEARPESTITHADLKRAYASVKAVIHLGDRGRDVDKDDLARRLFELSVRHEMVFGRDRASAWLRYAHLTATCTHDDLMAFKMLVGTGRWIEQLERAPRSLVDELAPIARKAAETLLGRRIAANDRAFWMAAAGVAPANGPLYVHTHTIAAIARIIDQSATESERWVYAELDGDGR